MNVNPLVLSKLIKKFGVSVAMSRTSLSSSFSLGAVLQDWCVQRVTYEATTTKTEEEPAFALRAWTSLWVRWKVGAHPICIGQVCCLMGMAGWVLFFTSGVLGFPVFLALMDFFFFFFLVKSWLYQYSRCYMRMRWWWSGYTWHQTQADSSLVPGRNQMCWNKSSPANMILCTDSLHVTQLTCISIHIW